MKKTTRTQKSNWQKLKSGEIDWTLSHHRAGIIRSIRHFFESRDFLEVNAPLLTPYPTLDSNIHSMETRFCEEKGKSHRLFLHTSPEHAMKKLLAGGAERIFFLGKVFRDRELTRLHNPEFTMLEWYRANATYNDIMQDTENLIHCIAQEHIQSNELVYQGLKIDLTLPWERTTLQTLFEREAGIDLKKSLSIEKLKKSASDHGIHVQKKEDWETIFFRIFLEKIEPKCGRSKPLFVMDYPAQMGLMAKRKEGEVDWVERVELYITGLEIANGYSELTDPDEQRTRFQQEQKMKANAGYSNYRIDDELLSALQLGMPPSAGMALGVDRLVMLLTNETDIQNVLLFPVCQWTAP